MLRGRIAIIKYNKKKEDERLEKEKQERRNKVSDRKYQKYLENMNKKMDGTVQTQLSYNWYPHDNYNIYDCRDVFRASDTETLLQYIKKKSYKSKEKSYWNPKDTYDRTILNTYDRILLVCSRNDIRMLLSDDMKDDTNYFIFGNNSTNLSIIGELLAKEKITLNLLLIIKFILNKCGCYNIANYIANSLLAPMLDFDVIEERQFTALVAFIQEIGLDLQNDIIARIHVDEKNRKYFDTVCNKLFKYGTENKCIAVFKLAQIFMLCHKIPIAYAVKQLIQRHKNMGFRLDIILDSLDNNYYSDYLTAYLDKATKNKLKNMKEEQYLALLPYCDQFFCEKGIVRIISNYIGLSKLFRR